MNCSAGGASGDFRGEKFPKDLILNPQLNSLDLYIQLKMQVAHALEQLELDSCIGTICIQYLRFCSLVVENFFKSFNIITALPVI